MSQKEQIAVATQVPWLPILLGIAGIIIGYTLVLFMQNGEVFASEQSCPYQCEGENCPHLSKCAQGECDHDCPGNCPHKGA